LEVHAVRPTVRRRVDGRTKVELLIMLTQKRKVLLQNGELPCSAPGPLEFIIRGGCTLLIDPEDKTITYAISKRLPTQDEIKNRTSVRLDRQLPICVNS